MMFWVVHVQRCKVPQSRTKRHKRVGGDDASQTVASVGDAEGRGRAVRGDTIFPGGDTINESLNSFSRMHFNRKVDTVTETATKKYT